MVLTTRILDNLAYIAGLTKDSAEYSTLKRNLYVMNKLLTSHSPIARMVSLLYSQGFLNDEPTKPSINLLLATLHALFIVHNDHTLLELSIKRNRLILSDLKSKKLNNHMSDLDYKLNLINIKIKKQDIKYAIFERTNLTKIIAKLLTSIISILSDDQILSSLELN